MSAGTIRLRYASGLAVDAGTSSWDAPLELLSL